MHVRLQSGKRSTLLSFALPVVLCGVMTAVLGAAQEKHSYYVGSRVCGQCHQGQSMGNQYSLWLLSKHARAYAVLSGPEAKEIVRLSGVTQEPQESPICLGCHATAGEAEKWEKDPTFFTGDGVQCEKCHGPGSEYMDAKVMSDRNAAVSAGLRIPTERDCMACHITKGSHVAVLNLPQLDIKQGWKTIAHPAPPNARFVEPASTPGKPAAFPGPRYVGVETCAGCHTGPKMGHQFSRWRLSAHARAYAVLATPAAFERARQEGLQEEPQKSPACLSCHSTAYNLQPGSAAESFSESEGIGCESCHGPGSEYMLEAVMLDKTAAKAAGLKPVTRDTCLPCHDKAHGKPFDYEAAFSEIAHPTKLPQAAETPPYKTPLRLALSPDARELYVACEASNSVMVVDVASRRKVAEIRVGGQPTDVTFSPDGKCAYVSNRLDDTVTVLDVATRTAIASYEVGIEPHGLRTDPAGRLLFVLNTSAGNVSVIDIRSGKEIKRLAASDAPWSLSLSPDGRKMLATNTRSRLVDFREPSLSEITVIDTGQAVVSDRYLVPDANYLQGVAWHPSGEFAFCTLKRTKNLVPMTRVVQGWTITNGLGIIWNDGRVDQVLLDETNRCFPDPTDVAFTPDGRRALVTSSGSDRVAVIDVDKLTAILKRATPEERERVLPNHLGQAPEFVLGYIPTQQSPRGIVVTPDGRSAFVANALDDSLTVLDLERLEAAGRIDLGGPKEISKARRGERLFHSALHTFQRQFSCHSCHPDGHINGLTFDIEPDGIGTSPVDNRTLRGILDTAPFKWEGTNPSLSHECGPRLAVFFTRIQPFAPDELAALVEYIATIPRPPNRYRPLGAELTDAQRRGREIFFRTTRNSGEVIPLENRCYNCHFGPMHTDRHTHNVGTQMIYDRTAAFDTPHLNNIYDSPPYLHNGIAHSLEEIWTRYNPRDTHGVTNDLTKDQLNDLIEYLKTL